jgi:hypothetical protein
MAVRLSVLCAAHPTLHRILFISTSGTHFCWRLSKPQSLMRPEGLGKLIKNFHLIESRARDFPAYSIMPQPLRYSVQCVYVFNNKEKR